MFCLNGNQKGIDFKLPFGYEKKNDGSKPENDPGIKSEVVYQSYEKK